MARSTHGGRVWMRRPAAVGGPHDDASGPPIPSPASSWTHRQRLTASASAVGSVRSPRSHMAVPRPRHTATRDSAPGNMGRCWGGGPSVHAPFLPSPRHPPPPRPRDQVHTLRSRAAARSRPRTHLLSRCLCVTSPLPCPREAPGRGC